MRTIISIFFICFICVIHSVRLCGQRLYPLQIKHDSLVFSMLFQGMQAKFQVVQAFKTFDSKRDFPTIKTMHLNEADLVIVYHTTRPASALSYAFQLYIALPDNQIVQLPVDQMQDRAGVDGQRELIWPDFLEMVGLYGSNPITLHMKCSIMGAVNCEAGRPKQSLFWQVTPYAGSTVGLAFLTLGSFYDREKRGAYDRYKTYWTEGAPQSEQPASALREAKQHRHTAQIFYVSGAGILIINAVLSKMNHSKIKRRQKVFDQFCGQSPSLKLAPSGSGIGLLYQF